jgi:cation transporter-like permease
VGATSQTRIVSIPWKNHAPLTEPLCPLEDIDVEIPVQFQQTVRLVYYVFLTYALALAVNVIAALFFTFLGHGGIGILLLAIIQAVLFTPCSFLFWFRPVYKAFR